MPHNGAVRAVAWGESNKLFATAADPFHSRERGCINIFDFPTEDMLEPAPAGQDPAPLHVPRPNSEIFVDDNDKAVCIGWTLSDTHIIAGMDSGTIVKYDVETSQEVARNTKAHTDRVNRLTFNRDKTLFVTASKDCYAKLIDPNNLEVIKEYKTDRPVNGACISPTHPHVLVGGGQDAHSVTTTGASSGKFETRFFHMIYAEEFGRVKGHFGPINGLAIHPYGKSYASCSQDGFIRVHRFEASYLNSSDLIPQDLKKEHNML
jgi:translation initiation factor 3 subunit I